MTCKQSLKSCQRSEGMSSGSYFRCDSAEIIICGSHKCKCTTQPLLAMHLIMSFILIFLSSSVYVSFMSFPLWSVFYPSIAYTFPFCFYLHPLVSSLVISESPCHYAISKPLKLGFEIYDSMIMSCFIQQYSIALTSWNRRKNITYYSYPNPPHYYWSLVNQCLVSKQRGLDDIMKAIVPSQGTDG